MLRHPLLRLPLPNNLEERFNPLRSNLPTSLTMVSPTHLLRSEDNLEVVEVCEVEETVVVE
jgi:hypothetical protein